MNKNKIILLSIIGIFLIFVIWVVTNLNADPKTDTNTTNVWTYNIWLYNDKSEWMDSILQNFKQKYPSYQSTNFVVESFSDYEDYTYALINAFSQWKWPDLYEINNSETNSILYWYSVWIHPETVNPNDFRKKYQNVFAEDLIEVQEITNWDETENIEYLRGLPIGFETLGIYYNKAKRINAADFESIGTLNSTIFELNENYPNSIPLAIWNGSTVANVADIIAQFFLLENDVENLSDAIGGKMKSALTSYMLYWDTSQDNAYNIRFSDMSSLDKSWIDLFVRSEVLMLVGYPRMLQMIDDAGFKSAFLGAEPFPFHNLAWGTTMLNYDYLVKNKDSINSELSDTLIQYFASDSWADDYLQEYSYYLPALLSLESDKWEAKVLEDYNILLGDFYNPNHLLQSFDLGIKNIFDREIVNILDNNSNYLDAFTQMQSSLLCRANKYNSLENLSADCK